MIARGTIFAALLALMMVGIYLVQDVGLLHFNQRNLSGLPVEIVKPRSAPAKASAELRLVTYNVLVDPVGLDKRAPALLKLMKESKADIIALQEVDDWFLDALAREAWSKDYTRIAKSLDCGGNVILSRLEVSSAGCLLLPGRQKRTALVAHIKDLNLDVVTSHMESALQDGPTRAAQLDVIFSPLANEAILMGDLNFGDGDAEQSHIPADFHDMWKTLHPGEAGCTWDNVKNGMAFNGSFPGEPSRRLDWILVKSAVWKPKTVQIIGDQPLVAGQRDLFPSDHFGVAGILAAD